MVLWSITDIIIINFLFIIVYVSKRCYNDEKTGKQLKEYFEGKRKKFDVPLNPKGTNFMKSVWTALQDIPYLVGYALGMNRKRFLLDWEKENV